MIFPVATAIILTAGLYAFRKWDRSREETNRILVLEAVEALAPYAYGVNISEWIEQKTGRRVSLGGIYCALDDLETEGLVGTADGPRRPERGNRRRVYFLPK